MSILNYASMSKEDIIEELIVLQGNHARLSTEYSELKCAVDKFLNAECIGIEAINSNLDELRDAVSGRAMSDPYEFQEYQDYRSDRTVCFHGSLRRSCADCEVEVQDLMIERLSAENSRLRAERDVLRQAAGLTASTLQKCPNCKSPDTRPENGVCEYCGY